MVFIGIDTGVHTGFAVWHSDTKHLAEVSTYTITQAMDRARELNDLCGLDSVRLYVDNALTNN